MMGLPVTGYDRFVDGEGAMRWRLLGLLRMAAASGPDISRSAAERAQIEALWIPSVLLAPTVSWHERDPRRVGVDVVLGDRRTRCEILVGSDGRLREISMLRWG